MESSRLVPVATMSSSSISTSLRVFIAKSLLASKPTRPTRRRAPSKAPRDRQALPVRAYLDEQKNVVFQADSDSVLTKGLAALLVQGLSNRPIEDIV
ncbi:hypothetical protein QYF36_010490 [Acer negundo]|nr:hypothetical protein QYF36_010490 [Acer negundo]